MTPSAPDLALSVAHSPLAESAPESPALLRERLGIFTLLLGGILSAIYVVGFVIVWIGYPAELVPTHLHPAKLLNLGMFVLLFGVSALVRSKNLPRRALQALDVGTTLVITLTVIYAVGTLPLGYASVFVALLLLVLTLTLRAAVIPSPPYRTLLIALVSGIALVIAAHGAARRDPLLPSFLTPLLVALGTAVWSGVIMASTTITSRVIYGLQRDVARALRLGQYTLVEKIGEGGMGSVYRARHAMLRRPTALKLLQPQRTGVASLARFEREVQLSSMLTHPNTIAIYDYGRTTDGVFYYAMEYVEGVSLEELVRRDGAQPPARVIHVLRQVVGALGEAHRVGLIHRDVKPANILLCERGGIADTAKVVDFGLVKQVDASGDATITQVNTITGTPAYMAPEMIASPDAIDARADLYNVGGVGYFMLTGTPVFEAPTIVEMCAHHLHTRPEPPSARLGQPVPPELEELLLRCLAKSPDQRPRSARVLEAELGALAERHPWTPVSRPSAPAPAA